MQQRQPRLGDILDDYCPRERRLTNHVVVAMVGDAVKQTRCSTCDSDHEYKHAALPRQRRKSEQTALYSQVLAAVTPRKMVPDPLPDPVVAVEEPAVSVASFEAEPVAAPEGDVAEFDELFDLPEEADGNQAEPIEEGPAHRRLIRAQLPRHEGQVSTTRQAPGLHDSTAEPRAAEAFRRAAGAWPGAVPGKSPGGGGGNGNGNSRGPGGPRHGGRPQGGSHPGNRPGGGRNRPK